ncbi:MAG: adenosylcobalamin-dependent ribonucleoside-diphosphate reductase [Candidatus Methanomethylicaceae archaeon]
MSLGANAMYVFRKLYFDSDETEPLQVFQRVSHAIVKARPDLQPWEERMIEAQFTNRLRVNTPAMMNLGCSRRQIASACFPAGTPVVTSRGLMAIEDIDVGTQVLTHEGNFAKVLRAGMTRKVTHLLRVKIEFLPDIQCTVEHPFYVYRDGELQWVAARELQENDLCVLVTPKDVMPLPSHFEGAELGLLDGLRLPVNEALMRFLGFYVGCGLAYNDNRVKLHFVHSTDALQWATEINEIVTQLFPQAKINTRALNGLLLTVDIQAEGLGSFCRVYIGSHDHKKIPAEIRYADKYLAEVFLDAVLRSCVPTKRGTSKIESRRLSLAWGIWEMMARLQSPGELRHRRSPNYAFPYCLEIMNGKNASPPQRLNDHMWLVPVKKVESINLKEYTAVYNMEVADAHSFAVLNVAVHNCFVGDLQDSMKSIKRFYDDATEVFLAGSGIGANFSDLREKDAPLSTGGTSSGPIAFIRHLNSLGGTIKSGGKTRRAAAMVMFDVSHPDVREVITLKTSESLPNINISINLTDAFMQAVMEDAEWELRGVCDREVKARVPARQILQLIAEASHACGDPGVAFLDTVNRFNTLPSLGPIRSSNPCGEQFLHRYGSCNLGSINLRAHCADGTFSWSELERTVRIAVRMLDGMIDAAEFPTPRFKEVATKTRNIGIGLMGLADTLVYLSLPYDSPKAWTFAGEVAKFITQTAWDESAVLAAEIGPFELWPESKERLAEIWQVKDPVRNAQVTTIAPTGTVSISAECSSGMEPLFAIVYEKVISDTGDIMTFVHPEFEQRYRREPWYSTSIINEIKRYNGSVQRVEGIPPEVKQLWKTAHDLKWVDRLHMQSALQKWITNSISSTVNLPHNTTAEAIAQIYLTAYELGLKGVTVYRDGSVADQPIKFGGNTSVDRRFQRPKRLWGFTERVKTGQGNMYVTINELNGVPIECFVEIGKSGGNKKAEAESLGRMVSLIFQLGGSAKLVYEQLAGIAGRDIVWSDGKQVLSIYDALAKVLWERYLDPEREAPYIHLSECPQCKIGRLIHKEGCSECLDCGYSKCG